MANRKKTAFELYLESQNSDRGLVYSQSTIDRYMYYIYPHLKNLDTVSDSDLFRIATAMITDHQNPIFYAAMRRYCLFRNIEPPKRPSFISKKSIANIVYMQKKILTMTEIKYVLKICRSNQNEHDAYQQLYQIIPPLYDTACRCNELTNIQQTDITFLDSEEDHNKGKYAEVLIRGKGGKNRVVYMDKLATDIVKYRIAKYPDYKYVFHFRVPNSDGVLYDNPNSRVYNLIKRYMAPLLDKVEISPHSFRHTRLTHMADDEVSPLMIKAYAGHGSLRQTEKYIHLSKASGRKAYEQSKTPQTRLV